MEISKQTCSSKIICKEAYGPLKDIFEQCCRGKDNWFKENIWQFPKVQQRLITKYHKELQIAKRDSTRFESLEKSELTPFYPLLCYPERENPAYQKFERRMMRYDQSIGAIKQTCETTMNSSKMTFVRSSFYAGAASTHPHDGSAMIETPIHKKKLRFFESQDKFMPNSQVMMMSPTVRLENIDEDQTEITDMPCTPGDGSFDEALCRDEKPVCFHCSKLFEFFYIRNRTISFPNLNTKSILSNLMATKTDQWGRSEVN